MDHETHEQIARLEEGQKRIEGLLKNDVAHLTARLDSLEAKFWWVIGIALVTLLGVVLK